MHTFSRLVMFIALATAGACAGTMARPQQPPVARLDQKGVSPQQQDVESGTLLQFINDDVRPHEIYSNDCRELASTPLGPGQVFVAQLDGPKQCHFQDLLAPTAPEYWGTVQVGEPATSPDTGTGF